VSSLASLSDPNAASGVALHPDRLLLSAALHALPLQDPATGLVFVRARWLDPKTGVFLTPDPQGYLDSSNLYAFAGGDPVNRRDPTGNNSLEDFKRSEKKKSTGCVMKLIVNRVPMKPFLQDCNGNVIPIPDEEPPAPKIDCYALRDGCFSAPEPAQPPTMSAASPPPEEPVLPYTKYGKNTDKAVATLQAGGNTLNGLDNAVREAVYGPGETLPDMFEPQSQVQATVQKRIEIVQDVIALVELGRGGVRMVRGRMPTRIPIKDPVVDADFVQNGSRIYNDTNPTARDPKFRTGEKIDGLSSTNNSTTKMHGEIGSMYQSGEAGNFGGEGTLRTSKTPCGFCKGDIKTMARKIGLEKLTIIDEETGNVYEFVGDDLKQVSKGGKSYKKAKKKK
jgi:RHS repeat-associated protein